MSTYMLKCATVGISQIFSIFALFYKSPEENLEMEDKRGFKKFWHFPDEDLLFMSPFCDFNAAPQWQLLHFILFA